MQLKLALQGKLSDQLNQELQQGSSAVSKAINEATVGLKLSMRSQVKSAGLSGRLANTWRGNVYPKNKVSISAAGLVYSNAPKIMIGFEEQTIIKGKDGFWLAIPTKAIPRKALGQKISPAVYERLRHAKLQFVYRPHGPSLLVHAKRKKSIIAFLLVPQVKMPKLINFETESKKWQDKVPSLILQNWTNDE